jgi:hypothetical protein
MFKKIMLAVCVLFLVFTMLGMAKADAANAVLSWTKSTSTGITGYTVWYGNAARGAAVTSPATWQYPYKKNFGDVATATIADLGPGNWFFAVTAYNGSAQSAYSNEATTTVATFTPPTEVVHTPVVIPATPGQVTVTTTIKVESTK